MPYRIINVDNEEEKVVRENLHVVITSKDNRYVRFGDDFMENVSILAEVRDEEKISFEILTEDEWRERKVGDELNYNDCYKKYLENEINDDIDKLLDLKAEITAVIETVEDEVLQLILLMRYINLKKWEYIAEKLNLEIRWLYRLHGRALEKVKLTIESH